jgi:hypothetical protein
MRRPTRRPRASYAPTPRSWNSTWKIQEFRPAGILKDFRVNKLRRDARLYEFGANCDYDLALNNEERNSRVLHAACGSCRNSLAQFSPQARTSQQNTGTDTISPPFDNFSLQTPSTNTPEERTITAKDRMIRRISEITLAENLSLANNTYALLNNVIVPLTQPDQNRRAVPPIYFVHEIGGTVSMCFDIIGEGL